MLRGFRRKRYFWLQVRQSSRQYTRARLDYETYFKKISSEISTENSIISIFHGMLGNHKNLRFVTQKLVKELNEKGKEKYQALSVTHRAHGNSEAGIEPHSIKSCANDAVELFKELNVQRNKALIGHSFGGKVILDILTELKNQQMNLPSNVILMDTIPFASNGIRTAGLQVETIIDKLLTLDPKFESKDVFVKGVENLGLPKAIGLWLTTSLRKQENMLTLGMDLEICKLLISDFLATDKTSILRDSAFKDVQFTIIKAERNEEWDNVDWRSLESNNVEVVTLKDSGHWVHTDQPLELVKILKTRIESS